MCHIKLLSTALTLHTSIELPTLTQMTISFKSATLLMPSNHWCQQSDPISEDTTAVRLCLPEFHCVSPCFTVLVSSAYSCHINIVPRVVIIFCGTCCSKGNCETIISRIQPKTLSLLFTNSYMNRTHVPVHTCAYL